jgi:hypothetical protein
MKTEITKTLSAGDQRLEELQAKLRGFYAARDGTYNAERCEEIRKLENTIEEILEARQTHDFEVSWSGTLYLLRPLHQRARAHLEANVQSGASWFGPSLAVEHRYIRPLVEQLVEEGFRVR